MKNIYVIPTDKPSRLCYVIDTEKSTLTLFEDEMEKSKRFFPQNIYITSDEKSKEGDWVTDCEFDKMKLVLEEEGDLTNWKKIILTTDHDLIEDGVQAIDDEFLEWFVKNPSCEEVETKVISTWWNSGIKKEYYKIIIPQEEPKQYPIGGYAPGNYTCTCVSCKTRFQGDKRAVQCEPCAIEMVKLKIKTNDNGGIQIDKQETLEDAKIRIRRANYVTANDGDIFEMGVKWQAERMYTYDEMRTIAYNACCLGQLDSPTEGKFNEWIQQFKKI